MACSGDNARKDITMEFADKMTATLVIFGLLGVFYVVIWHPWRTILTLWYIWCGISLIVLFIILVNIWTA